jgi:hypothetical protein
MFRTDDDTRRFQTDVRPVRAIVAFLRNHRVGIDKYRIVRTSLRAGFARNASAVIKIDDSVFACEKRFGWANLDAWRVGAMVAAHYRKKTARVGKFAFLDVFHPSAIYADRNIVFGFTSHRTSVAADAFAVIYDKTVVH